MFDTPYNKGLKYCRGTMGKRATTARERRNRNYNHTTVVNNYYYYNEPPQQTVQQSQPVQPQVNQVQNNTNNEKSISKEDNKEIIKPFKMMIRYI